MPRCTTPIRMPPITLISVMISPATASPRTNFEAPSMAPKNALSSSSSLRRRRASSSSISPAPISASIAICLPGIASSENRAATSAIRVEPFVITTKLMITRMAKITTPITKFPATMNLENPWITSPAACIPAWPSLRISRVEATFSDSRSMVVTSSSVGKELNCKGDGIQSATMKISTESESDSASPKSNRIGGSGRNSTASTSAMPTAKLTSLLAPNMLSCGRRVLGFVLIPHPPPGRW